MTPLRAAKTQSLSQEILTVFEELFSKKVGLHEPHFVGKEWEYVKECLDTGWVSTVGNFVDRFEENLSEITGISQAVAMVNGTAALHMALNLSGVKPGDEVLVPDLGFVAVANSVVYAGAIPHFLDSSYKTLGVCPETLEKGLKENTRIKGKNCMNKKTGRRIKALIAVHTFGHPVDLEALKAICEKYHLILIEDAAEALGSIYRGKHVGQIGDFTVLSFNGNKIVTTGGGGALLTCDAQKAKLAKHLTTTAKIPHPWRFDHDHLGFNYRLPNLNAALGLAQLESLPDFLKNKRSLAKRYSQAFKDLKGILFFSEPEFARSNYWLNVLLLDQVEMKQRDEVLSLLNEKGYMCRPSWTLLHKQVMFKDAPRMDVSNSEDLEQRIINIPSSAFL